MNSSVSFIPYGSISVEANTEGAVGTFKDITSIQATNIRVYNAGTVEIFVSTGSSEGEKATATVPTKDESTGSFSIAPHTSEIITKNEGDDQVAAITAGGKSAVRFSAIKLPNAGGDLMSSLELVSVLKDAMSNQKMIDSAAKKIAEAHTISAAKRKEAQDSAKTIEDSVKILDEVVKSKAKLAEQIAEHQSIVGDFDVHTAKMQEIIEAQRQLAKDESEKQLDAIATLQQKAEDRHLSADKREADVSAREKTVNTKELLVEAREIQHEKATDKLIDEKSAHEDAVAKFNARKKKLEDATKED